MKKSELTAAVNARLAETNQALAKLDDDTALDVLALFPVYQVGKDYEVNDRFRHEDKLYRVLQAHTSQTDWLPENTPALYAEIAKPGEGETPANPIAYNNNMALEQSKYYEQNGIVYVCTRDTVTPVYNNLADLIGLYVEVYSE